MTFDARSARALSRRVHSLHDCLSVMKQSVVQAAQAGEFEVSVGLAEVLPVRAGRSTNNAAFLVDFLVQHGRDAWAEAATQAMHAGYTVRPAWGRSDAGAALEGMTLSWRSVAASEFGTKEATAATALLMPAAHALAMSQAEQAHVRWVEGQRDVIQRAARQGRVSVALHDALPLHDAAWRKRCELLQRAGFTAELIAADSGATLVVGW